MHDDASAASAASPTARARDLGIPLPGIPGPFNALTDVPGVEVGLVTLRPDDRSACTGVTAILPRGRDGAGTPVAAATFSLNGNGELTGRTWIEESGQFSTPVLITNSHAVGAAHTGTDRWMHAHHPEASAAWLLPVVGETWDGYLNHINAERVTPEHAVQALDAARTGPVAEGSVGGGTGMNCYGFKGGTGTSSRVVPLGEASFTVAALVQANFGDRDEFTVLGVPLGSRSEAPCPLERTEWFAQELGAAHRSVPGAGSVIVVLATDAPLLPQQLAGLARRASLGLARTGTAGGHFSGDIFLAFSTANAGSLRSVMPSAPGAATHDSLEFVAWGQVDPLYTAAVEAVEEAVLNALVNNEDVEGRDGHRSYALPHAEVLAADFSHARR
ncbi:MAG: P1 family peptidase [Arthrobacter sp.]|jgi:L-aminopeptidase/D-esterase-like protein|nr:P1 family peptidase [Arthrobacter sp.]